MYWAIIFAFVFSCSLRKDVSNLNSVNDTIPQLIIQENYKPAKDNYPFSIVEAKLNDNLLYIIVKYKGGCRQHIFKLYTDKIFMKSKPPKLNLFLEHNPNEDLCKSIVIDTIMYDISGAKYPDKDKNYTVEIMLSEYTQQLKYSY